MAPYTRRVVDDEIDELAASLSAIALEGARGVGKTATGLQRAATVRRLDDPTTQALAQADTQQLLTGPYPVLLDEWEKVPPIWDAVRRAVDAGSAPHSFLLTGSAAPPQLPTHSGAGRIVTVRMRPMTLAERGFERPTVSLRQVLTGQQQPIKGTTAAGARDYAEEIVRSGLPGLRSLRGRALRAQLDSYLRRIVEHDFNDQGHRLRNPAALLRWLQAYAAATATTTSQEKIRHAAAGGDSSAPAKSTTQPYRDILQQLWLVEPVPAWQPTRSRLNRLASPPKHQLVDPGLAARLLGVDADALLDPNTPAAPFQNGPLLGALFESLVCLSVLVFAQAAESRVMHMRSASGLHAIDLVVERDDGRIVAIEVKLAHHVHDHDVAHLQWLRQKVGTELLDALVIYSGTTAYRRPDGIAVVPAALLGP